MKLCTGETLARKIKKGKCIVFRCTNTPRKQRRVCCSCMKKEWRRKNPKMDSFAHIKFHAKERGIIFTLTFEEFVKLTEECDFGKRRLFHIDRIDASRGYETGNVQILTVSENVAKGNRERMCPRYQAALKKRFEKEEADFVKEWY